MGDEDKQFEASQQKLRKARKEGQVVKSKDFSTAISLIVMFMIIYSLGPFIWDQIAGLFSNLYEQIPNANFNQIGIRYLLFVTLIPNQFRQSQDHLSTTNYISKYPESHFLTIHFRTVDQEKSNQKLFLHPPSVLELHHKTS